jgi:RNA polymerase sigma-70 factor (ECF subfamily)
MAEGPAVGLAEIEALATSGELDSYHLLYAARADLLRRLGAREDAVRSYLRAIQLVTNDSEKRFLERRLREVQASASSIAT